MILSCDETLLEVEFLHQSTTHDILHHIPRCEIFSLVDKKTSQVVKHLMCSKKEKEKEDILHQMEIYGK